MFVPKFPSTAKMYRLRYDISVIHHGAHDTQRPVHLFAVAALRRDPALVARHTVVVVLVWDEGLSTDGLLTAVTHKAVLVPRGAAIL